MDKKGFRSMLQERNIQPEQIEPAIELAERFETYIENKPRTAESAWRFSKLLIKERINSYDNYVTLIRYCSFISNDDMYTAFMELVDGGEVGENMYRMVAEQFGPHVRDEVYGDIGIPPYGLPTPEKPATLHPVLNRIQEKIGHQACRDFLSACLRDLPDSYYQDVRKNFEKAGNLDEFLRIKHQEFVRRLKSCQDKGELFFVQEITDEVVDFVKSNQEIGGGIRDGQIVYVTKIPYMTKKFLGESDPILRRYYACHCPWARDAIRNNDTNLVEDFCYCSGGFHKKPFEVIFRKPLKVDLMESVIAGSEYCRFAIHLPVEAVVS